MWKVNNYYRQAKRKKKKRQGDRDDAQEITAFWEYIFYRISLNQTFFSKGRRGKDINTFLWMR